MTAMPAILSSVVDTVRRRVARHRRRRAVASAYDMAREIRPEIGDGGAILDIGCGKGYIAMHLAGLAHASVHGADIHAGPEAPIPYTRLEGPGLPFDAASFSAVLLCYVLHHVPDPSALLGETRRVLRPGGRLVIYEDIPTTWFDRLLARRHVSDWRTRAEGCSFLLLEAWKGILRSVGLRLLRARSLSRFRDWNHPIERAFLVAEKA